METRVCTVCSVEFPLTKEYFFVDRKARGGLATMCKKCKYERFKYVDRKRARKYYQENREHVLEYAKEYAQNSQERIGKYQMQYRDTHKETAKEYIKGYNKINFERLKVKKKEYFEKNRERFREIQKTRLPIRREQMKVYYAQNKFRFDVYRQRRRSQKAALESTLQPIDWKKIVDHFGNCCVYCGKKAKTLHQEHFIALSRGGEYTINNIVPACRSCNSSKRDTDFFEWYPKQKCYSKKREQKLLSYLGYKENTQQLALAF